MFVFRKILGLGLMLSLVACGSSSSSSSSDGTATVSSMSDLPDADSMVAGDSTAAASLSAKSVTKAVSGTPLTIVDIDSDTAKDLFWKDGESNVIDDVILANDATEEQQSNFWRMEGSCRMAQTVGYAFQDLKQATTSSCYMKNAPEVLDLSSVTIADGAQELAASTDIFTPQEEDFIVQVSPTNMPMDDEEEGGAGDQNIFIRVYGTNSLANANDYSIDLWFCAADGDTPTGYEQLRYDSSTGNYTSSNVSTDFANFTAEFSAKLTEGDDGLEFDTSSARSAVMNFEFGGQQGKFEISVNDGILTAKQYFVNDNGENKTYAAAQYSGDTITNVGFLQAGYKGAFTNGDFSNEYDGATEYQDDHYEAMELDLLSDVDLLSTATDYDMDGDSFFTSAPDAVTTGISDFSCSPTVSYTVAMDFSEPALAEVATQCESAFNGKDMQFCDSEDVQAARQIIQDSFVAP